MSSFIVPEEQQIIICFPIPLPQLELSTNLEETGFTRPEKVSLLNAFRILKLRTKQHARQIYLNFYTDHETVLERYRCGLDRFYLKTLNEHTLWLLESLMRLVDQGLDNPMLFNIILTELATRHKAQRFSESDVTLLAQNMRSYILEVLKKVSSPTLVNAVTKLCQLLVVYAFGEDLTYLKDMNISETNKKNSEESFESTHSTFRTIRLAEKKKRLRQSLMSVCESTENGKLQKILSEI